VNKEMKEPLGFQLGISVLEGPARQKQLKYMNIVLFASTLFIAITSFFIIDILRESDFRLGLIITALLINASSWITLRRGNLRFSGLSLVLGYWVLSSFVIAQTGGLYSPWLISQFSIIVLGGLLAGGNGGIVVASLSIITDFIFYRMHLNGLMLAQLSEEPLIERWVSTFVNLSIGAVVIVVARQLAKDSLENVTTGDKRYRSLFEKTNDAVFLIDLNQAYIDVNQQAADLLGYSVDELIGMPVERIVVPEERSSSQEKIKSLGEETVIPVYERKVVCKDGSRKTVEVNLALVSDDEGKPLHYQSIVRDVSERKRLEQQLKDSLSEMEDIAMQDPLTGMLNRRAIMEHAEAEWHRSQRENRPMCILAIDVDNLKIINDKMGHLAGDKALVVLAQAIKGSKRRYDWTGRWGGDEFLMVLPDTNLVEAEIVAERLRQSFKETEFSKDQEESITPKVSLGISCLSGRAGDDTPLDKLLAQADQALYSAKESGRDRVGVHRD
jgi:diguanylate cyclase (GGDEF)-like protein/PAS domain S-box-containing protein